MRVEKEKELKRSMLKCEKKKEKIMQGNSTEILSRKQYQDATLIREIKHGIILDELGKLFLNAWGTVAQWICHLLTVPRDLGLKPGRG